VTRKIHLIPQPLLLAKEKGSQNFFLFPSPLQGEGARDEVFQLTLGKSQ